MSRSNVGVWADFGREGAIRRATGTRTKGAVIPHAAPAGDSRIRRSGRALVPVMLAADLRDGHDTATRRRLHFARMGAVVVDGLMRARGVVVREATAQQASEMPYVDHDDVIAPSQYRPRCRRPASTS